MRKCFLSAWLFGWLAAIYVPSVLIAFLGLSEQAAAIGVGFDNIFATTWRVADDASPWAKLSYGAFLLVFFFALARVRLRRFSLFAAAAACGVSAMAATLAVLPEDYSDGFGIGLAGARFDLALTPIYLIGGAAAGVVFAALLLRCGERG